MARGQLTAWLKRAAKVMERARLPRRPSSLPAEEVPSRPPTVCHKRLVRTADLEGDAPEMGH